MTNAGKIALLLFLLFSAASRAQQRSGNRIEIEADPVAFIFNGYSFHLGYTVGHIRFDAGVFGIRQPEFVLENKMFSVFSSGVGVKADYIFKKDRGLFFGLQSDYATDKIGLRTSGQKQFSEGITLGARAGYRFMFGKEHNNRKGLYLVPWVALIHAFNPARISENGYQYNQGRWSVFPTIHLGYRF